MEFKNQKKNPQNGKISISILFVIVSITVAIFAIIVSAIRELTPLENSLLWVFSLAAAFVGSYMFAKQSSRKTLFDIIKPHARPAFRRLLWLYNSLSRLAFAIN